MKGNLRTLLRRFCLETTILGLKYFYLYPDFISRCFWSLTMAAVVFLAFVLTQRIHFRFSEMPTRITIENQYEPVVNLPYPAITICSPNQLTNSFMKKLNESLVEEDPEIDLEKALPYLLGMYEVLPDMNSSALVQLQSLMENRNISVSELMGLLAQSCDSFLKICYFEMQPYENCKTILHPILTARGLCCTFNNKYFYNGKTNELTPNMKTRTVKATGEGKGLVVVADYDPGDAIENTILSGGAVKIMYSDSLEFPTSEMTLVETNVEAFHVINAAYKYCSDEVTTLIPQQRRCYLGHETSLPYFDNYRKSDCDLMCTVQAVEDECDCLLFYVPHATTRHFCNVTSIPCIIKVKYLSNYMNACDCLSDCESRQYAADVTVGNFNAVPYMLHDIYRDIKFNKSTIIMNFFFTNSMYVKKKQETVMSLTIFASSLGGIFGLCLGCSCISLLEVLFSGYKAVRNYSRRRKQRNFVRYFDYTN